MASTEERLVQNQESFRHANERLGRAVASAEFDGKVIPFLCECADDRCLGRIELSLVQYDDAHLLPNTFVVLTGHPLSEAEEMVEDMGLYQVMQKG
jgi:hypothetical protein